MTRKTTTIREYDDQGGLVRETVTEEIDGHEQHRRSIWWACTCPSTWCQLHSLNTSSPQWIVTADSANTATTTAGEIRWGHPV
jgi:hypothetical protein